MSGRLEEQMIQMARIESKFRALSKLAPMLALALAAQIQAGTSAGAGSWIKLDAKYDSPGETEIRFHASTSLSYLEGTLDAAIDLAETLERWKRVAAGA